MSDLFGILGLTLLLLSWIHEAYQTVKTKEAKVPFEFCVLYFVASLFLTYHAYLLSDLIFMVLNLATSLISLLNLYYIIKFPRKL